MLKQLLSSLALKPYCRNPLISLSSRGLRPMSTTTVEATSHMSTEPEHQPISTAAVEASPSEIPQEQQPISAVEANPLGFPPRFGPYPLNPKEVFYNTTLSFAFVNLRPVVPDVLVCPVREVERFTHLTVYEASDMWLTAQKVGRELEAYHKATSLTFTIQDGPHSGQTVPHVHIHILPRKAGDFENNDDIYEAIDGKEKELKEKLDLDKERTDRSLEEMAQEADEYRALFISSKEDDK